MERSASRVKAGLGSRLGEKELLFDLLLGIQA